MLKKNDHIQIYQTTEQNINYSDQTFRLREQFNRMGTGKLTIAI